MGNSSSLTTVKRAAFEGLESRRLLSAGTSTVNFANFASTSGLVLNGFGSSAATAKNELLLTDGSGNEARSVWTSQEVGTQTFSTSFLFQINSGAQLGDGFTFTLQNHGTGSLGNFGSGVGYHGIVRSVAISFFTFNYDTASFVSYFRFLSDGADPNSVTPKATKPIDLHSGDKFSVTITYDGTLLDVHVVDTANPADTFVAHEDIDLHTTLDSYAAYAGFTAGTGNYVSTQKIESWSYTGTDPVASPTIVTAAAASPSPVTGTSTDLSILGSSVDGAGSLTYTWSTIQAPSGAKAIIYSDNSDNTADSTTATFSKDGNYMFECTITDINGQAVTSDVDVEVQQTATLMKISPHGADIPEGGTQQFTAEVFDQFHHGMRAQPTITYSILSGNGGITAEGVYHAAHQLGHVEIQAQGGGFTVTDGATIVK
jgi:hypothetical protein